jgi:hypothetical protein
MNPIGLLEQQEELRRLSQQIHFLSGKARGEAKRQRCYFQLIRLVRRLRKRLRRDLETVCLALRLRLEWWIGCHLRTASITVASRRL